jgi:mono/diheme cytochrome c family protein
MNCRRRSIRTRPSAVAALLLLTPPGGAAWAQDPSPAPASTLDGVYTERQARKGESTFGKQCTACHVPAAITGMPFRKTWSGRTVGEFFELIRTTMPEDNPGKLSRGQYADIIAYLLQLNGYPPGEKPLPADDGALQRIRIDTTSGS